MTHDCERLSGPRWSTRGDSRVTFVGGFLRRSHTDELPQLWNVLRGEMSLIGPRPERPEFVMQFVRLLPRYAERLLIRPGLSGAAQIQLGPDTDLDSVRRKLAYDLYYVQHLGPWLDCRIACGTLGHLVGWRPERLRYFLGLPGLGAVQALYDGSLPAAKCHSDNAGEPSSAKQTATDELLPVSLG
jgi:lipopolysaccharide/colanic/teichoic acid biosynthesis glycosyltransferase